MWHEDRALTGISGAALEQGRRVKVSSGKLVYATATELGIGITARAVAAADLPVPFYLLSVQGSVEVCIASACAFGAKLYCAANGKVDDSGTVPFGDALQAATVADQLAETQINPQFNPTALPAPPSTAGGYKLSVSAEGVPSFAATTLPEPPTVAGAYKLSVSAQGVATWAADT